MPLRYPLCSWALCLGWLRGCRLHYSRTWGPCVNAIILSICPGYPTSLACTLMKSLDRSNIVVSYTDICIAWIDDVGYLNTECYYIWSTTTQSTQGHPVAWRYTQSREVSSRTMYIALGSVTGDYLFHPGRSPW